MDRTVRTAYQRSPARPVPFAVMERAGVVGFMLVLGLFFVGLFQPDRQADRAGADAGLRQRGVVQLRPVERRRDRRPGAGPWMETALQAAFWARENHFGHGIGVLA